MQMATVSLYLHTGEREDDLFGISSSSCKDEFHVGTPPTTPSNLITPQRPPSFNTATLALRCIRLEGMQTPGQGPLCTGSSPWFEGRCYLCLFLVRNAWTKLCARDYLRAANTLKHILCFQHSVSERKIFYYSLLSFLQTPKPQQGCNLPLGET